MATRDIVVGGASAGFDIQSRILANFESQSARIKETIC